MGKSRFIKDGYTGRMPPRFCPVCFLLLTANTNLTSKDKPEPGDFTVCIKCASVLRFDGKMDLELSSLMAIPVACRLDFAKVVQAIKADGPYAKRTL
jgi:hypothetical protein